MKASFRLSGLRRRLILSVFMFGLLALATMLLSAEAESNLVQNGDFSGGLTGWGIPKDNCCTGFLCLYRACAKVSSEGSSGNPHLELAGYQYNCPSCNGEWEWAWVTQKIEFPANAEHTTLSLKVWKMLPEFHSNLSLSFFDTRGTELALEQQFHPEKQAVTKTYDVSGLRGTVQTLKILGINVAVDDVSITYRPGTQTPTTTTSGPKTEACTVTSTTTATSTTIVRQTEALTVFSTATQTKIERTVTIVSTQNQTLTLTTQTPTYVTETQTITKTNTSAVVLGPLSGTVSAILVALVVLVPFAYMVGRRTRRPPSREKKPTRVFGKDER